MNIRFFATAIFSILMQGCSAFLHVTAEKPKVTLDHVAIENVSIDGASAVFFLQIENPNRYSLKLDSLKYSIELADKKIATSQISQPVEVAGKKSEKVSIPVPFKFLDLFSGILALFKEKTTNYRLTGEAIIGGMSVPFDEKGEFKIE